MNADRQGLDSLPVCVMKNAGMSWTDATVAKEREAVQRISGID